MWRVGLGANARRMHRTLTTTRSTIHPDYTEDMQNNIRLNDIGILTLLTPIERTLSNIFPIRITPYAHHHELVNTQGMILGFAGATTIGNEGLEDLQVTYVRVLTQPECAQAYPNGANQQLFCAGDRQRRGNFCLGDQVMKY
jgi:hypothetical protein